MPRRAGIGGLGPGLGVHGLKSGEAAKVRGMSLPLYTCSENNLQAVARDVGDQVLQEQREKVIRFQSFDFSADNSG